MLVRPQHSAGRDTTSVGESTRLSIPRRLARYSAAALVGPDVAVTGITASSSSCDPGDVFAALSGRIRHGARFAPDAIAAGGVAVLTDPAGAAQLPLHVLDAGRHLTCGPCSGGLRR